MDAIEQRWYERDFNEATAISRQLAIAMPGTTAQHIIDVNRFCECCEDNEGYDVPKERMRDLKAAGLVSGGRFGWYTLTDEGQRVRDAWYGIHRPERDAAE